MPSQPIRPSIISSVTSPLGLLALMALVTESLLFILTQKATGNDLTIIIIGMVSVMVIVIPVVLILVYKRSGLPDRCPINDRYHKPFDIFISAPMAAWNSDEEYQTHRSFVLNLRDALVAHCKFKHIFYAGTDISKAEWEPNDISAKEDFSALYHSKYVILLYPKQLASSALVEIGAAIANGTSCIFFVSSRNVLPFILKNADNAFDNIKIYEVEHQEDILRHIHEQGVGLFNFD